MIATGCQKTLSNENAAGSVSGKEFNTTFVKNWYYETFKKTSEWLNSDEHGKKLPDWKNGILTTIGKLPAVEYPLIKATSSFSIAGGNDLTTSQRKKIADASLSKIAFIKTAKNGIIVREIDYIPDWEYLESKQFNIGELKTEDEKREFTGRVVVKKWDGTIVSSRLLVDGKTVKIGIKADNKTPLNTAKANNTNSLENCTSIQYCVWQQDCVLVIYGDGMNTNECGQWYITEVCWEETTCTGEEEDPCVTLGNCGEGGGSQDIVIDMIDNPCLRQVLDKMNNINGTYFKEIVNTFDNTDVINVSLYNYFDSNNGTLGETTGVLGTNSFTIGINTFYSNGSSEEDIAGTYIHEMVHAYLLAYPTTWDTNNPQHLIMMTNLLDKMAGDLRIIFPVLPEKDSYAIAFNGLTYDSDPSFQSANNIIRAIMIEKLNSKFPGVTIAEMSNLGKSYQKGGNKGTKTSNCQ